MNRRVIEIDTTKGLLTIWMILCHVIQLLSIRTNIPFKAITFFTNLISSSGFYFCLGYAVWLAYLGREKLPWGRILRTAGKCYGAFVVSGFAYRFLVDREAGLREFFRIAFLRDVPGYS